MVNKYILLKNKINEEILANKYPLDSKLPTEQEMATMYNVSRSTVRLALAELEKDGIIAKKWGSGNTVIAKRDSAKSKTVLLIVSDKRFLPENTIAEITAILLKEQLLIEVYESKSDVGKERALLEPMLNDIYYGLIIQPAASALPNPNTDILQRLLRRQTPILFLGNVPSGLYSASSITLDYYDKGYQLARKYINLGHKSIGGIFLRDNIASVICYQGFVEALRDANLVMNEANFLWVNSFDHNGSGTRQSTFINRFIRATTEKVDIIYCDDSILARNHEALKINENIAPAKSIGKEAANLFISIKKNGNVQSITIPFK